MKIRPLGRQVLVAFVGLGAAVAASAQTATAPLELYSGLTRGMTPDEASIAILRLDGVKAAKVKKQKKPEPVMCVDVSHDMSKGGDYGGQKGFPYLECDSQGLKAVIVRFAEGKNAYRDLVPMCLSSASASYTRLEELLGSRYKEVGRSDVSFDDSFVRSARLLAAKEKLEIALGKKSIGSLDVVDPFIVFTDGQRAIILKSSVRHWSFYKTLPNMAQAMCSADEGWQAQPEIRYASMAEFLAENKERRESRDRQDAERDKRDADSL